MNNENTPQQEYQFETKAQAEQFIISHLRAILPADETALIDMAHDALLIQKEPIEATAPPGGAPILLPRFRWVIKNEDLGLIDAILDGVRAAASAGFFAVAGIPNPTQWAAIVALTAAVYKVCRNAVRKSKVLDPDTYAVLAAVKACGPVSEKELLTRLHESDKKWKLSTVRSTLSALKAMPRKDGNILQLVSQDQTKKWQVAGL